MADKVTTRSVSERKGSGIVGALLACAAAWIAARNLSLPTQDGWIFWVPTTLWLLTMSGLCWWAVLGHSPAGVSAAWRWGRIVGGVGLMFGFVGPLVVHPQGSLGPLLGILLTGPIGFVAGAIAGGFSASSGPKA